MACGADYYYSHGEVPPATDKLSKYFCPNVNLAEYMDVTLSNICFTFKSLKADIGKDHPGSLYDVIANAVNPATCYKFSCADLDTCASDGVMQPLPRAIGANQIDSVQTCTSPGRTVAGSFVGSYVDYM